MMRSQNSGNDRFVNGVRVCRRPPAASRKRAKPVTPERPEPRQSSSSALPIMVSSRGRANLPVRRDAGRSAEHTTKSTPSEPTAPRRAWGNARVWWQSLWSQAGNSLHSIELRSRMKFDFAQATLKPQSRSTASGQVRPTTGESNDAPIL
jgi:hypothetical protein